MAFSRAKQIKKQLLHLKYRYNVQEKIGSDNRFESKKRYDRLKLREDKLHGKVST